MFQFREVETAVQAAKMLAFRHAVPIFVMARTAGDVFSIGLRTDATVREAGRHVATVYWSGNVHYEDNRYAMDLWKLVRRGLV